jgi:hypothetical protein
MTVGYDERAADHDRAPPALHLDQLVLPIATVLRWCANAEPGVVRMAGTGLRVSCVAGLAEGRREIVHAVRSAKRRCYSFHNQNPHSGSLEVALQERK